jgi:hypothetical protein
MATCEELLLEIQNLTDQINANQTQINILEEQKASIQNLINNTSANSQCITVEKGENMLVTMQKLVQIAVSGNNCAYTDQFHAPLGLNVIEIGAESARLVWSQYAVQNAGGFQVQILDITAGETQYQIYGNAVESEFQEVLTGLYPLHEYSVRIVASSTLGAECTSVAVKFTTLK